MGFNDRHKKESGNAVVEFALVCWPLLLLLMGTVSIGLSLGRSVQVAQVCRDSGTMYVRGVDFSKDGNKDIIVRLGQTLGLARTGGTGVVILTKITWIPQSTCTALSLSPCNGDKHVMVQRLTIGNTAARTSALGTPGSTDSLGLVSNYLTDPSAVATVNFIQLVNNECAYVAEAYFPSPGFDFPGFRTGSGNYSRAVF
jgi:hypothetical protein